MTLTTIALLASLAGTPAPTPLRDAVRAINVETFARDMQTPPRTPTVRERLDVFLLSTSISACSVALGVTMACTSDGSCEEINRGMRAVINHSRTNAILLKAASCGAVNYLGWRFLNGRVRTLFLGFNAGFNVWDGWRDARLLREIDRGR